MFVLTFAEMKEQIVQLGLKANWKQFSLLVLVNAFVGAMLGLERTILPEFAEHRFGISSAKAILSFIVAFGIMKAIANYVSGRLANHFGRKRLLLFGWILALPVPWLLLYAPSWNWVIMANVLLGISQGLTWSSTVVMKMDLVGEKERGMAMGLNEFAGYLALGLTALLMSIIAHRYGVYPYPFYVGIFIPLIGLLITWLGVRDTGVLVQHENKTNHNRALSNVFWETTLKNKTLSSITQAGLVNNLNDGMIWGLLPMVLHQLHVNTQASGMVSALYPAVWGIGQLFTGKMADHFPKKAMLFWGMLMQGIAILAIPFTYSLMGLSTLAVILGLGTALVYPTFLSAIAGVTRPLQRAETMGVFRLWRDLGYAIGAILSGIIADQFGLKYAIGFIGGLTVFSAVIIQWRMPQQENKITQARSSLVKKIPVRLEYQ